MRPPGLPAACTHASVGTAGVGSSTLSACLPTADSGCWSCRAPPAPRPASRHCWTPRHQRWRIPGRTRRWGQLLPPHRPCSRLPRPVRQATGGPASCVPSCTTCNRRPPAGPAHLALPCPPCSPQVQPAGPQRGAPARGQQLWRRAQVCQPAVIAGASPMAHRMFAALLLQQAGEAGQALPGASVPGGRRPARRSSGSAAQRACRWQRRRECAAGRAWSGGQLTNAASCSLLALKCRM